MSDIYWHFGFNKHIFGDFYFIDFLFKNRNMNYFLHFLNYLLCNHLVHNLFHNFLHFYDLFNDSWHRNYFLNNFFHLHNFGHLDNFFYHFFNDCGHRNGFFNNSFHRNQFLFENVYDLRSIDEMVDHFFDFHNMVNFYNDGLFNLDFFVHNRLYSFVDRLFDILFLNFNYFVLDWNRNKSINNFFNFLHLDYGFFNLHCHLFDSISENRLLYDHINSLYYLLNISDLNYLVLYHRNFNNSFFHLWNSDYFLHDFFDWHLFYYHMRLDFRCWEIDRFLNHNLFYSFNFHNFWYFLHNLYVFFYYNFYGFYDFHYLLYFYQFLYF